MGMRFLKKVSIIMVTVARIDPNGKRSGLTGRSLSMVTDTPADSRPLVSLASKLLVWPLKE